MRQRQRGGRGREGEVLIDSFLRLVFFLRVLDFNKSGRSFARRLGCEKKASLRMAYGVELGWAW